MTIVRPEKILVGGKKLKTPVFFPSISTVKTQLTPSDYLSILCSLQSDRLLISAFDLSVAGDESSALTEKLQDALGENVTILMDSGNYESFWKNRQSHWLERNFHKALEQYPCTFAFGFDEQNPPDDFHEHCALAIQQWRKDQSNSTQRQIIPILHPPSGKAGILPHVCAHVAQETCVPVIAVAERHMGDSVFDRVRAISTLRKALNDTGRYVGLHVLGTGNPISIALFSWAGADSFDGLEWCQTVVDHTSGLLFHFSQADFFLNQTHWGEEDDAFPLRVLAHNLDFYSKWMNQLSAAVHNGDVKKFLSSRIPKNIYEKCTEVFTYES